MGKIAFLIKMLKMLKNSSFFKISGRLRKYPKVIQLPITYRCNSKCCMCNIWKMDNTNEASIEEFKRFISDPIFKHVYYVGINGGETSLVNNLSEYVDEILKLPNLKGINIISNGFLTNRFLTVAKNINEKCIQKNKTFHISISLDGVNDIHDKVRGVPGVFEKVIKTIDEINSNLKKYCDSFDIACTVINQNVNNLIELEEYAAEKGWPIKFRLGISNKRIGNETLFNGFSVLNNENIQSAKEFFYRRYYLARDLNEKFKYFSIFYWLNSKKRKRLLGCAWKDQGITMDSRGDLYYCAVASKKIGSLRVENGVSVFFNKDNLKYRESLVSNECSNCIHDYTGKNEILSILIFLFDILKIRYSMKIYKFKCRLGIL